MGGLNVPSRLVELAARINAMTTDKVRIEAVDEDLQKACAVAGLDPAVVLREVDVILREQR